ncbi:aspartic peptidase domain-containing protein [Cunninghamella echinulata]|nr:aspartic peptidase domain-containing protein [Cunninghamella echinulata]
MYYILSTCILFFTSTFIFNESPQASPTIVNPPLIRAPLIKRTSANLTKTILSQKAKRDPFQSNLYNYEAVTYLVNLAIGTPLQNFTVAVDTGSSDLWVPSTTCSTTDCPHSRFDSTQSSSFQNLSQSFDIKYGSGAVNGVYGKDTVIIGNVQVSNQQFGLASSAKGVFDTDTTTVGGSGSSSNNNDPTPNGILGLGYPLLTTNSQTRSNYNPVVFNMIEQKLIANAIFSIYMNQREASGWAGEIIFGGVDQSKYTGDLVYAPNVPQASNNGRSIYSYWMVYAQGIALNGTSNDQTISFTSSSSSSSGLSNEFIIDTGTTLTYLPSDIAQTIVSSITTNFAYNPNLQVFEIDCDLAQSSSATIQFQIAQSSHTSSNPVTLSIPVANLIFPLGNIGNTKVCMFGIAPSGGSSGSSSSGSGSDNGISISPGMMLVGDSILRHIYLVFDIGNNRIGFAAANGAGGSVNGVSASLTPNQAIASDPNLLSLKLMVFTAFLFCFFG